MLILFSILLADIGPVVFLSKFDLKGKSLGAGLAAKPDYPQGFGHGRGGSAQIQAGGSSHPPAPWFPPTRPACWLLYF